MSYDELKRLKWQRPFQPFRITTLDNEVYDVMAAGLILVGVNDITIGLPHPERPPPAASEILSLGIENIARAELLAIQI